MCYCDVTLETLNLFSNHQYYFRSGRSTADALAVICERVYLSLDLCGETRANYTRHLYGFR